MFTSSKKPLFVTASDNVYFSYTVNSIGFSIINTYKLVSTNTSMNHTVNSSI